MKKFTLLIALFVCAIGFSQTGSLTNWADSNPSELQTETTSNRRTLVSSSEGNDATVTFTLLADFLAACTDPLTSEDFSNGPGGITDCGLIVSSAGDGCFPPGELEDGFDIQASTVTTVIYIGTGLIGNTSVLMGANTFLEYTIINFTGADDVTSVGMDIWNNSDPDTDYRVYDTGGVLVETFSLNNTVATENFFGIMTDYAIGHIEIEGLNGSGELYGNFLFGDCGGGSTGFSDDFELYTVGTQLVVQNQVDWDTWSGTAGGGEDPFVSDLYSYSGSNSVVEIPGNDFIHRFGDQTTGMWYISFLFYIPSGNSGYFNTMSNFDAAFEWAHEVNFDAGGAGRIDTAGSLTGNIVDFTYYVGQWNQAMVVVDLDATPPLAEFWTGASPGTFTQIAAWDYTQGGTKLTQLAVTDFYGGTSTDEMYIDDYYFGDTPPVTIPVELTSFAANVNNEGDVILNWSTATELNNQMFEIERRSEEGQYLMIGYVNGHGTTTETQEYSYVDNNVETGTYFYRLKQIDFIGTYEYSDEIEIEVNGPLTFNLEQNYPNPFNPSTNIKYNIPESGIVKLAIYNTLGEEVAVLVDGIVEAGFYEVTFDASNFPSGAYFYRLQSDNLNQVKKMLLLK